MMLGFLGLLCIAAGVILYYVTYLFPVLRSVYLDWFALFIIALAWFLTLYKVIKADVYKHADSTPKNKHLIEYLRRDTKDIPCYGERVYSGESFLEVPNLGLIEYIGRDCFYTRGNKKYVLGLENMNYTPDPRFGNFTYLLWELGFNSSDDVRNVLRGKDLELMAKVYCNMENWDDNHGANKLVTDMENYDGKTVSFKPRVWELAKKKIDEVIKK